MREIVELFDCEIVGIPDPMARTELGPAVATFETYGEAEAAGKAFLIGNGASGSFFRINKRFELRETK